MKKIDIDTIFKIFDQDDREIYEQAGLSDLFYDERILLNVVVRGIENYWKLDELYTNKEPIRYEQIKHKVKVKFFNKMYNFFNRINQNNLESFYYTVQDLGYGTVETALQEFLDHFVELEEYEKCCSINKSLNLIKFLFYPETTVEKK